MRWRSATSSQRRAFLDELPDDVPVHGWRLRRRTARLMGLDLEVPA